MVQGHLNNHDIGLQTSKYVEQYAMCQPQHRAGHAERLADFKARAETFSLRTQRTWTLKQKGFGDRKPVPMRSCSTADRASRRSKYCQMSCVRCVHWTKNNRCPCLENIRTSRSHLRGVQILTWIITQHPRVLQDWLFWLAREQQVMFVWAHDDTPVTRQPSILEGAGRWVLSCMYMYIYIYLNNLQVLPGYELVHWFHLAHHGTACAVGHWSFRKRPDHF